ENWREEGNPLDVIPVCMGEKDVGGNAVPVGGSDQRAAQLANARSRIENDQPIRLRPHLYTWGVATISNRGGSRRWYRPARSREPQSQCHETGASMLRGQNGEFLLESARKGVTAAG